MVLTWFDALPAWLRHIIIGVLPVALGFISAHVIPALSGKGLQGAALVFVLQELVLILTPITKQYGVGARGARVQP